MIVFPAIGHAVAVHIRPCPQHHHRKRHDFQRAQRIGGCHRDLRGPARAAGQPRRIQRDDRERAHSRVERTRLVLEFQPRAVPRAGIHRDIVHVPALARFRRIRNKAESEPHLLPRIRGEVEGRHLPTACAGETRCPGGQRRAGLDAIRVTAGRRKRQIRRAAVHRQLHHTAVIRILRILQLAVHEVPEHQLRVRTQLDRLAHQPRVHAVLVFPHRRRPGIPGVTGRPGAVRADVPEIARAGVGPRALPRLHVIPETDSPDRRRPTEHAAPGIHDMQQDVRQGFLDHEDILHVGRIENQRRPHHIERVRPVGRAQPRGIQRLHPVRERVAVGRRARNRRLVTAWNRTGHRRRLPCIAVAPPPERCRCDDVIVRHSRQHGPRRVGFLRTRQRRVFNDRGHGE
ncbi:MAG: hypothetical protein BWY59_00889 [Verrucomicrobia bacterium ADurb.Bin345]|nr:MAG: hypothetical protein BWY59_00889 [Verrucomicrobia bacterium ADurb.Bin345]